jgi:tRNA 2-thiouridine synthesizing protein A
MIEIDVRGLGCPIPVVKTKQAMEKDPSSTITVCGDTNVSQENILRLAEAKKYSVESEKSAGEEYRLVLKPGLQ